MRGMWLVLQQPAAEDFFFATGKLHSVQDIADVAFKTAGLDGKQHIDYDEQLLRRSEPARLVGNSEKAHRSSGGCRQKPSLRRPWPRTEATAKQKTNSVYCRYANISPDPSGKVQNKRTSLFMYSYMFRRTCEYLQK